MTSDILTIVIGLIAISAYIAFVSVLMVAFLELISRNN
jgi:hypothetical protein